MKGFKNYFERVVFGTITLLILLSLSWSWWARSEVKRIRANPVSVRLAKTVHQAVELPVSTIKRQRWAMPSPQSAGDGWVYELFTPPVVFYNPSTKQFAVTYPSDGVKTPPAFAIELVTVRRELYRLQLSGYFGETGSYTVAFTQPGQPAVRLAREGTRLEELALTLRKFFIRRPSSSGDPATDFLEPDAFAELHDERTNTTVVLNSRAPRFADEAVATIKMSSVNSVLREVRAGDVISEGKIIYRINRVTYMPAELVVSCEEPGRSAIETKVLHPVDVDATKIVQQSIDKSSLLPRPATGFVIPEK